MSLPLFPFRRRPRPRLPRLRRVYAVGDIHGRLDLLHQIYGRIITDDAARAPANTEIVLLGDLIDRGPQSAEVIRFAMETEPAFAQLTVLPGNHEDAMLRALEGDRDMLARWLRFGGVDTLESFGVDPVLAEDGPADAVLAAARAAVPATVRQWLATRPLHREIGDYLFVHAGIRPGIPIAEQERDDQLWIRAGFLDSREDLGRTVVHGHTIVRAVERHRNRIAIDTGAYATGRLTAIGLEGDRQWFLNT